MISRIIGNGTYYAVLSIFLTIFECNAQMKFYDDLTLAKSLIFLLFVFHVVFFCMSSFVLLFKKIIYNSFFEISCTLSILFLFTINKFFITTPIYFFIGLLTMQLFYRMRIFLNIEAENLVSKYMNIREFLSLEKKSIKVMFYKNGFVTSICGKDIYFNNDSSLFFNKKRITFDVIKQLQVEFAKPFISFDDNEIKIAEMYSI